MLKINYKLWIFIFLLGILIQSVRYDGKTNYAKDISITIDLAYLNQRLDSANYYYKNNALFLAVNQMNFLKQSSFSNYSDSIKMKIGACYQLINHIYFDIGYISDIKNTIDSMYYYKSSASKYKPIYKAEYYTYLSRYYALEMKFKLSKVAIDSAFYYYETSTEKNLISKYFLYFNYLNVLRNIGDNTINKINNIEGNFNSRETADSLIDFVKKSDMNWYIKSYCLKVRANLYQDYMGGIRNTTNKVNFFIKTLERIKEAECYSIKLNGIIDVPGIHMKLVEGLQYYYVDSIEIAFAKYKNTLNDIDLIVDGKTYPRFAFERLFISHYEVYNILTCDNKEFKEDLIDSLLNNSLKLKKIYIQYLNNYMMNCPEYLAEGYEKSIYHDIAILSEILFYKTGKSNYKTLAWDYSNLSKSFSLYYKLFQNKYPIEFPKLVNYIDSITNVQNCLLDQLFLARKHKLIIDTTAIKNQIKTIDISYDKALEQSSIFIKKFLKAEPLQDIAEIQNKLDNNTAIINYDGTNYNTKRYNIAMVLTNNNLKIVRIPSDSSNHSYYLDENNYYNSTSFFKMTNYYSKIYFEPIKAFIENCDKLTIIPFEKIEYLPFDMLLENPEENNLLSNIQYLGMKYNIRYTSSTNVESMLQLIPDYKSDSMLIISPDYVNSERENQLPFNKMLSKKLSNEYKSITVKTKKELNKSSHESPNYNIMHIAAHEKLDGMLLKDLIYRNMSTLEKFYIFDDTTITENYLGLFNYKANLAVVASCNSGLSYFEVYDGKLDISRMLLKNGVKSVITTPWRLDDKTSAEILSEFYTLIDKGYKKSEALWMAKKHFLKKVSDPDLRNPIYWAGFRLEGCDGEIYRPSLYKRYKLILIFGLGGLLMLIYIAFRALRAFR